MTNEFHNFSLTTEYIELIKLLKLLNLVESGADAKIVVEEGLVKYNGEVEFRKRKKLRAGDTVIFQNNTITIS
ncbi:MAG: RNA-binding S4 domain-containing protein [Flavobacteriales bacterium]|nr:RNA-binding S4 domain-containing protein [Flavobacteriales bacterium]NQX98128.1 RNA-binding S4 domain-containing protein [Flavobacteriales bacterium]